MPNPPDPPLRRLIETPVHGRVLVTPGSESASSRWLVGFHGYAQNAEIVLPALLASAPKGWRVASVQALHPFYTRTEQIVASWMTRQDRDAAIADNVAYVDRVLEMLEQEAGAVRSLVFAGFSQGAAMAYRAGLLGRRRPAGIVVAGGELPPELRVAGATDWPPVLAMTGRTDASYPPAALERDHAFLLTRSAGAQARVFEGGHEWSEPVTTATREWLAAIAAGPER